MGMAAGQARLLSITARLSDNETNGQSLSYAKQRLADQTEQVNAAYNTALSATKLTVLTNFNGSEANYTDISYGLMTGFESVACGKQYIVTNQKGEILVTNEYARAFEAGNGDFNIFLAELGYTQADLTVNSGSTDEEAKAEALEKIHQAWDKYLTSVGYAYGDAEHDAIGFKFFDDTNKTMFNGYATYTTKNSGTINSGRNAAPAANGDVVGGVGGGDISLTTTRPLNYEGSTREQKELYDYAIAITNQYYSNGKYNPAGSTANVQLVSTDSVDTGYEDYLRNIFNKMSECGYYTEANENDTIRDNTWFEEQLKEGKLLLQYFSASDSAFVSTSISDDDAIQEVEDEKEIARVEAKYNQDIAALEKKDQRIDLELKKLDTEHNALQNEYDSVKSVIEKNVEKSFNIFS